MAEIRKDLNDMVTNIVLKKIKTRYNERNVCEVTLFNGEKFEFKDTEGLYDLFASYKKIGKFDGLIKSRKLVEEEKKDGTMDGIVDEATNTYVCVLYELSNGRTFRLFLNRPFVDKMILDNYYDLFKTGQRQKTQPQVK